MIYFNFNIRNPWSQRFKNLWSRTWVTPFEYKFIELEFYRDTSLVSINFNWSIRQSHAGIDIELGLLGYCAHFNLYDSRHWDYHKSSWEVYNND